MASVATPHGLAVAGALFMLGGLAILGAALLNRALLSNLKTSLDTPAKLGVAAGFALPMIGLGLFLQAAGNMVDVAIGPGLTVLLLSLAFAILLFVLLDETIAEALDHRAARPLSSGPAQATLPAPVQEVIASTAPPQVAPDAPKIALAS